MMKLLLSGGAAVWRLLDKRSFCVYVLHAKNVDKSFNPLHRVPIWPSEGNRVDALNTNIGKRLCLSNGALSNFGNNAT
jgi:hypothetical protein